MHYMHTLAGDGKIHVANVHGEGAARPYRPTIEVTDGKEIRQVEHP